MNVGAKLYSYRFTVSMIGIIYHFQILHYNLGVNEVLVVDLVIRTQ